LSWFVQESCRDVRDWPRPREDSEVTCQNLEDLNHSKVSGRNIMIEVQHGPLVSVVNDVHS
jgi:hypothetical protein